MRCHVVTLAALLVMTTSVMASQEQRYQENVNWAKQAAGKTQAQSEFTNFSVNELCKDTACQQQLTNPEQTRYRNDATAMDSAKTAAMATDETAQAVTSNFNKGRPAIDPNDPAYSRAAGYMNDAYTISHGLVSQYHDCEKGQTCKFSESVKQCSQPTHTPYTCDITPYVISQNEHIGSQRFPMSYPRSNAGNARVTSAGLHITLPAKVIVTRIELPPFGVQSNTRSVSIYANGRHIKNAPASPYWSDPWDMCGPIGSFCWSEVGAQKMNVSIDTPTLSLTIRAADGRTGVHLMDRGAITVHWKTRTLNIGWKNSCGPKLPECSKTQEVCVEGAGSRWLHGVYQTLPCWKKRQTYQCSYPDTCASLSTCVEQSRQCSKNTQGICVQEQVTKKCTTQTCVDTNLICGNTSYCLDGECFTPEGTHNTEFNQAASNLAAISDAAKGLGDPPLIFTGKPMTCSKKPIGLSDCCKDSGWGSDIGLAQCSDEEKALMEAKEKKLTISLGQYCAEKVLGVCIRKKKAYCTFDSKLARIVQEQGKPQLGMDFGSAKHPDCSAITPEQMQQMDFSAIDFSDFYTDLHSNMTLPDNGQIQQRIKQAMKEKQ
ncbi:type-F conjugative transfer system mating-pair stabilization protein TraN [Photobacterium frigidiphilum]|uniref:Type-F conjugative transfer system mating-pair stabilization protein TraN n=1 Tax=Photobacterium frigidiphilum TaxID=264736 RepID=A0A2T3J5X8_9GAMM|nr:type-F conjugative transfer system mating-pair stabilization protein TraN [Photobacterium frigidiphilum]PSU41895.1 type-F conjugative transfer system mating-pair stabilization protein TraN [Photobacterium frigidiphilum]